MPEWRGVAHRTAWRYEWNNVYTSMECERGEDDECNGLYDPSRECDGDDLGRLKSGSALVLGLNFSSPPSLSSRFSSLLCEIYQEKVDFSNEDLFVLR